MNTRKDGLIQTLPKLYTFRRCPYAMRARLALVYSGASVEYCEIELRNKPTAMLTISPKGTVPVLQLPDGTVLEESLDIMHWALKQNDPDNWLATDGYQSLLAINDGSFKKALDRYKYADRHPEQPASSYRAQGEEFLKELEQRLQQHRYLISDYITLADAAIAPFVRQFAHVDRDWFFATPYTALQHWLNNWLESVLFTTVMEKRKPNES